MPYFYSPFRKEYNAKPPEGCQFCNAEILQKQAIRNKSGQIIENDHYLWIVNYFPKCEGHTLLIPKRHIISLADEQPEEVQSRQNIMSIAVVAIQKLYPEAGVEIFLQTGPGSESSIQHLHWHIVPSLPTDVIRGIQKIDIYTTTEPNEEKVILYPMAIQKYREGLQEELGHSVD